MSAPTVDRIQFEGAIADRAAYHAIVTYPNGGGTVSVTFTGPARGMGVVLMSTDYGRHWVRVDDPARFGPEFGYNWVRAFFA